MTTVCLLCLESHIGLSDLSVTYQAKGFFNGTAHYAYIHNGIYTNDKSNKTVKLSPTQQDELGRVLKFYKGQFHEMRKEDKPQGGDRGTTRFVYDNRYGHPDKMPELAKLFLDLDERLGWGPGALRV